MRKGSGVCRLQYQTKRYDSNYKIFLHFSANPTKVNKKYRPIRCMLWMFYSVITVVEEGIAPNPASINVNKYTRIKKSDAALKT
jgi:hypothetical protein